MTEATGLAGRARDWAALAWGAGQALGRAGTARTGEGRAGRVAGRRAGKRWVQVAGAGSGTAWARRGAGAQAAAAREAPLAGAHRRGRARQACGLGAGRAAWARGLALGCALGALGLFLARFDSVFFLSHQMNTVHCKINFEKRKYFKFN